MPDKEKAPATAIWTLMSDSATTLQVGIVKAAIEKHNQGKFAQLSRFTNESLVEYFLELGMRSTLTAIDADRERRNKDAYTNEMSKLEAPNVTGDAVKDLANAMEYMAKTTALRSKYGIGGDKKEV